MSPTVSPSCATRAPCVPSPRSSSASSAVSPDSPCSSPLCSPSRAAGPSSRPSCSPSCWSGSSSSGLRRHPHRGDPPRQPAARRRRHVAGHHRGPLALGARARRPGPALHRVGGSGRSRSPAARSRNADGRRQQGPRQGDHRDAVDLEGRGAGGRRRGRGAHRRRSQAQGRPHPPHRPPDVGPVAVGLLLAATAFFVIGTFVV